MARRCLARALHGSVWRGKARQDIPAMKNENDIPAYQKFLITGSLMLLGGLLGGWLVGLFT